MDTVYKYETPLFVPSMGQDKKIQWRCVSDDVPAKFLPPRCK